MNVVAQSYGVVKGKVIVKDSVPIEYATVRFMQDGNFIIGINTNEQGFFTFDSVPLGIYDIRISYVGFEIYIIEDIEIKENTVIDIGEVQLTRVPLSSDRRIIDIDKILIERGYK
jgi:hypothetical protein